MDTKREYSEHELQFETDSGVRISIEKSRTSTSLLRKVKSLDDEAWQELVDTYGDRIYYWSLRTGMSPSDAHDITAEVFVAILRKVGDFQHKSRAGGFRKWIRVITKNKIRDYWRKNTHLAQPIGGSSWYQNLGAIPFEEKQQLASSEDALPDERSGVEWVEAVRSEVSERDWGILQRIIMEQRSVKDVASEFGVSENTVYLVKSRLLKRLRHRAEMEVGSDSPENIQ